jgi:putative ATPase
LLRLYPINADDIKHLLKRAVSDSRGLDSSVKIGEPELDLIADLSNGDARKALTILEVAAGSVIESLEIAGSGVAESKVTDSKTQASVTSGADLENESSVPADLVGTDLETKTSATAGATTANLEKEVSLAADSTTAGLETNNLVTESLADADFRAVGSAAPDSEAVDLKKEASVAAGETSADLETRASVTVGEAAAEQETKTIGAADSEIKSLVTDSLTRAGATTVDSEKEVSLAADPKTKASLTADSKKKRTLKDATPVITREIIKNILDEAFLRYDRDGDEHYDVASAFIKSMRGSDVDAALHYLARMIEGGEDPRFIARRIMIAVSEEVAMADPSALQTAVAAAQATEMVGLPEARIILAQAVVHVATAPKSNASYLGIERALYDVQQGNIGSVPIHLRDTHYQAAKKFYGHGVDYQYAHDSEGAIARQEYLPEVLKDAQYYYPNDRGYEAVVQKRLVEIKKRLKKN